MNLLSLACYWQLVQYIWVNSQVKQVLFYLTVRVETYVGVEKIKYVKNYSEFCWCVICDLLKMHDEDNIKLINKCLVKYDFN
jgi:hypothetical protein